MPARFNLYSAWIDPVFYGWAAAFAAGLFLFALSLRRWLALRAIAPAAGAAEPEPEINPFLEDPAPAAAQEAAAAAAPEAAPEEEKTLVLAPGEQQAFLAAATAAEAAAAETAPPSEGEGNPEALPGTQPGPFAEPAAQPVDLLAAELEAALPPAEQASPAAAAPEEPAPAAAAAPAVSPEGDHTAAENFVRGIYAGIADLDERMKNIEAALSKGHVNSDFAVKFLEDMVQDMDSLDKSKIKARLEYLLSDLKK